MIAGIVWESASNLINSVPSGFNLLYRSTIGTRTHTQAVYWKIATASDVAASTFTWGFSSSIENAGFLSAFSGVLTPTPIGDWARSSTDASSVNAVCPELIVRANNVQLCIASNMYGTTWTAPSGSPTFAEIADYRTGTGTANLSLHASWATATATGGTGTKTCVALNADYWKAGQIELIDASYALEIPEITVPPAPHLLTVNKSHHRAQTLIWGHVFAGCGGGAKVEDIATRFVSSDIVGGAQVDGGHLILDGNDDAVKMPSSIGTFFSHAKSTFAVGFKWKTPRADGSYSQIFIASSTAATYPKLSLNISVSNVLSLTVIGTSSANWYGKVVHEPLQNGRWYHIVVTQDGNGPRIYINGKYPAQSHLTGGTGSTAYWFAQVTGTIQYCLGAWWTGDHLRLRQSGSGLFLLLG